MLPEVRKKSFVPRGPTTMSGLALVRNSGQKLPIQFNEHGQPVGATSKKMQSYIGVCVRQQIPMTYNSWKEVLNELKDKIYDCISMSFDLQPNAKHSILMFASRKFRTFKTTLTQKYILPSKDQPSLLQFPPKIYSHINQEDWESFVDARLSEEWEKEARKGRNNDYFDDATRDCASRIDELVATNKNEDILTDALGSKEHGGREHSTRKDVVYSSNYTDVNEIIKLLIRHAVNNMNDVNMIRIPMNELIFGSDKFVYLAHEDLLHYCGMVEIGYMCILAYITFHWMLHVIDLRENCVYVLDSLRSKVNEDIHGIINVGLKTWQAKHDLQRYRSTPKWRPVKCPRQLDSVGCRYYVQKYIHEIVYNSSTSITSLFNTKNAYRQEEIDEIRTEWAAFVSRLCVG
ncbi:hypothetical protein IC582_024673 [Cucumis melo]